MGVELKVMEQSRERFVIYWSGKEWNRARSGKERNRVGRSGEEWNGVGTNEMEGEREE